MNYDPTIHNRKNIRLKEYDYSQAGAYFVTMVTHGSVCLFGAIKNNEMFLNQFGQIVRQTWFELPNHYMRVELGTFCIMPNHVHGIVILNDDIVGAGLHNWQGVCGDKDLGTHKNLACISRPAPTPIPLFEIIRALKSFSARRINAIRKMTGTPVWQRNYYEHVIRDEDDFKRIQFYIENNPANWNEDKENSKYKM